MNSSSSHSHFLWWSHLWLEWRSGFFTHTHQLTLSWLYVHDLNDLSMNFQLRYVFLCSTRRSIKKQWNGKIVAVPFESADSTSPFWGSHFVVHQHNFMCIPVPLRGLAATGVVPQRSSKWRGRLFSFTRWDGFMYSSLWMNIEWTLNIRYQKMHFFWNCPRFTL